VNNVDDRGIYPILSNRGGVMGILSTTPTNIKNFSKKKLEIYYL
jgi:hypothetical protein